MQSVPYFPRNDVTNQERSQTCYIFIYIEEDRYKRITYKMHLVCPWRKIAGSIPDEVVGFFNLPNPSSRTIALGFIQPLDINEYQKQINNVSGE
jgi:hypothetical protein